MRVGALLQNWQEYCKKIIFKTNKPKKYNETQQNSTGIKLQGGKHTHTHIQKKNKTNPFNAGSYKNRFLNERKKKKSEPQSSI